MTEALPEPGFSTIRLGEGYDRDQVDAFVARVLATMRGLAADPVSTADVLAVRFSPTRVSLGYDIGEVDAWLDRAAAALGGLPTAPSPTWAPGAYAASAPPARARESGPPDFRVIHGPRAAVVVLALALVALLVWWLTG